MRGKLIVVSGPSGSGKTTIAREILRRYPLLQFSVSATTRPCRAGEVEGKDYYFLSREEFLHRVEMGEFAEWEELYGHYYGTPRSEIEGRLRLGKHLLFDVDVRGALSIKRLYPEAMLIFVAPPNRQILEERLRRRQTEGDEALARRLARADLELDMGKKFDHRVVNDALQQALAEVERIVEHYLQMASEGDVHGTQTN